MLPSTSDTNSARIQYLGSDVQHLQQCFVLWLPFVCLSISMLTAIRLLVLPFQVKEVMWRNIVVAHSNVQRLPSSLECWVSSMVLQVYGFPLPEVHATGNSTATVQHNEQDRTCDCQFLHTISPCIPKLTKMELIHLALQSIQLNMMGTWMMSKITAFGTQQSLLSPKTNNCAITSVGLLKMAKGIKWGGAARERTQAFCFPCQHSATELHLPPATTSFSCPYVHNLLLVSCWLCCLGLLFGQMMGTDNQTPKAAISLITLVPIMRLYSNPYTTNI